MIEEFQILTPYKWGVYSRYVLRRLFGRRNVIYKDKEILVYGVLIRKKEKYIFRNHLDMGLLYIIRAKDQDYEIVSM